MSSNGNSFMPSSTKGKEPAVPIAPAPPQPVYPHKHSARRPPLSDATFAKPHSQLKEPQSAGVFSTYEQPARDANRRGANRGSSTTWTSSSAEPGLLSETEDADDRGGFVKGYNQLAKQYGIRLLVPDDFPSHVTAATASLPHRKGSWFSRLLRPSSTSGQPPSASVRSNSQPLGHRRSISDIAPSLTYQTGKDGLKDYDLKNLVRLCGKSVLHLPPEYAPCSLVLPTCFRALAQPLVQQADTRGIFRVSGSFRTVNALYDHYCVYSDTSNITSTTRCPTLPNHIKYNVHDVASAFKKLLAGLPGGILGSLSLFDALVAIHSQLQGAPETKQTKETKLRARLIAWAVGTVPSQYQRQLICAVLGILCLIGRAAEHARREDDAGHPLPTGDLMGYNALGIIFGPLLINDLINSYNMKIADPANGLVLLPVTPPRSRKERHKEKHKHKNRHKKDQSQSSHNTTALVVDKMHIANGIAEMLITHWREVVRHMKELGSVRAKRETEHMELRDNINATKPSTSDLFTLKKPPDWDAPVPPASAGSKSTSPENASPTPLPRK
ncbi:hypothetical protein F4780DRAFT_606550 [Xylariomycetidae sp. FL0641]|nr:hypothetical protein F4780DRAFT_606550 [Xylariomycetidae sp. FL0641]